MQSSSADLLLPGPTPDGFTGPEGPHVDGQRGLQGHAGDPDPGPGLRHEPVRAVREAGRSRRGELDDRQGRMAGDGARDARVSARVARDTTYMEKPLGLLSRRVLPVARNLVSLSA